MYSIPDKEEKFPHSFEAVVESCGKNQLRVRCWGTTWNSKIHPDCAPKKLSPGDPVTVVGRIGIRLIIVTD